MKHYYIKWLLCVNIDVPAAIYRDDLALDYVAYWLVEFNSSQYAVVSAGAQTGPFKKHHCYVFICYTSKQYVSNDVCNRAINNVYL